MLTSKSTIEEIHDYYLEAIDNARGYDEPQRISALADAYRVTISVKLATIGPRKPIHITPSDLK